MQLFALELRYTPAFRHYTTFHWFYDSYLGTLIVTLRQANES